MEPRTPEGKALLDLIYTTKKYKECPSLIYHGPGHQSKTNCKEIGKHTVHHATFGEFYSTQFWTDKGGDEDQDELEEIYWKEYEINSIKRAKQQRREYIKAIRAIEDRYG